MQQRTRPHTNEQLTLNSRLACEKTTTHKLPAYSNSHLACKKSTPPGSQLHDLISEANHPHPQNQMISDHLKLLNVTDT